MESQDGFGLAHAEKALGNRRLEHRRRVGRAAVTGARDDVAEAVRDKATMYRLLAAGQFGNTIPQFFSAAEWQAHPDSRRYPFWGVRSARTSMHPACRLYCPAVEVAEYAARHFPDGPNISMMVDAVAGVRAWLEVWDSPTGLVVEAAVG